jgi:hypothetical protein
MTGGTYGYSTSITSSTHSSNASCSASLRRAHVLATHRTPSRLCPLSILAPVCHLPCFRPLVSFLQPVLSLTICKSHRDGKGHSSSSLARTKGSPPFLSYRWFVLSHVGSKYFAPSRVVLRNKSSAMQALPSWYVIQLARPGLSYPRSQRQCAYYLEPNLLPAQ